MSFSFDQSFLKLMMDHQLRDVVILGHVNPDGDAVGAVCGLAHYIHTNYPQFRVYPYIPLLKDPGPRILASRDCVFSLAEAPAVEHYCVIVCDSAAPERISGKEYYENAAVSLVIDHHASNRKYGQENYVKIAESCCEVIWESLNPAKIRDNFRVEKEKNAKAPSAAEYLYLGILHDTDGFKRASAVTMQGAAHLIDIGVNHREMMQTLQTLTLEGLQKQNRMIQKAKTAASGRVAYVSISKEEAAAESISYEEIHPVSGLLRDCADIEVGFTMYELDPGVWKFSLRSMGTNVNVNRLLQNFGGGGHDAAAGLVLKTDLPEQVRDQMIQMMEQELNRGLQNPPGEKQ